MKRIFLLLVWCITYISLSAQGIKWDTCSVEEAMVKAKAEKKLILAYATAPWCLPCQEMKKEVLDLEEIGYFCHQHFLCVEVNVDGTAGKAFRKKYGVNSIPAFLVLQTDGNVRHRLQGRKNREDFKDGLERGIHLKSSLLYLEHLQEQGKKLSNRRLMDYYIALKAAKEQKKADSIQKILFAHSSVRERSKSTYWPLYRQENRGSISFREVETHPEVFRRGWGEKRLTHYLCQNYQNTAQMILYQQDRSEGGKLLSDSIWQQLSLQEKPGKTSLAAEQENALVWAELTRAYVRNDTVNVVKGLKMLAGRKQWRDCLWYVYIAAALQTSPEDKAEIGSLLAGVIQENSKDRMEAWDFYQKFKYLGFPVLCNQGFWEKALEQARSEAKPILLECVRGQDAYYINRRWMWDFPGMQAYIDSLCVSVRIDMEAPDVIDLQQRFGISRYPAYFLLDIKGKVYDHWEGTIEEEDTFQQSLVKGIKKLSDIE